MIFALALVLAPLSGRCAASLFPQKIAEIEGAISNSIASGQLPGAVLWLERQGDSHHAAYGLRAVAPSKESMTEDTIFDAASLTKVLATTPAILLLAERGKLQIDAAVTSVLPEFQGAGKERITLRHLLTHTSGLRPGLSLAEPWTGYDTAIAKACAEPAQGPPGQAFRYSDINFILLGEIVRRVSGSALDVYADKHFYGPLDMSDTRFRPPDRLRSRVAPTEQTTNGVLRGMVHDPTAQRMGGVAGHAGVFTTARDVARFARMLLGEGSLDGARVLAPQSVRAMTQVASPSEVPERRGLGWDIDSPYAGLRGRHFPIGSYGHTGWTGTSLWIDPFSRTFVILLSNRNHPTEAGTVLSLRSQIGTLAAEAVAGFNFAFVPGALSPRVAKTNAATTAAGNGGATREVLNGVDVLARQECKPLRGLRLGLITNQTGIDRTRKPTIDVLRQTPGIQLKALFSPEHGIRGQADADVGDSVDAASGLPVFSLYGATRQPTAEQLKELDALVFDIQDIGCRFYTYISTLGLSLQAAARAGLKFFVLDRVNPINGVDVDGPLLDGPTSFTAFHSLPVRHGMTVGELARLFNAELKLEVDLTVIPLEGWTRALWFDQTSLPWINPSPNMRSLTQAALYPGIGLLETTALSVGRGTDTPFEVIGAPYVDDRQLAAALNQLLLPGVRFIPVRFTPSASTFQGQSCGGVNILVTDRERCASLDVGIAAAHVLHRLYPGRFDLAPFNRLLQHPATIEALRAARPIAAVRQAWGPNLEAFRKRRAPFLLY
jgi:uncharacterized protein YbbC (DUF1343 family)